MFTNYFLIYTGMYIIFTVLHSNSKVILAHTNKSVRHCATALSMMFCKSGRMLQAPTRALPVTDTVQDWLACSCVVPSAKGQRKLSAFCLNKYTSHFYFILLTYIFVIFFFKYEVELVK